MKYTLHNTMNGVKAIGMVCLLGLASCDSGGGSSDGSSAGTDIQLPDDPAAAVDFGPADFDPDTVNDTAEEAYVSAVFAGINAERSRNGLADLVIDTDLVTLAETHNENMINLATVGGGISISHNGALLRADAAFVKGYTNYGENVGANRGFTNDQIADNLLNGWIGSDGHFENLNGNFTHTGLAITVDSRDGTIYATQVFAR